VNAVGKIGFRCVVPSLLVTFALTACTVTGQSDGQVTSVQIATPASGMELSNALQILFMLTALAFVPLVLIMMTAFVRIVVVLSISRSAIGVPQLPPNQVIISLALILTFFVMSPVLAQVNDQALQPYLSGQIDQATALEKGLAPLREFMFKQVRDEDLALFINMAKLPRPYDRGDVPTSVLLPAFVISELRTAFQMAFIIYVPFLVIDMVVSSALLSMGMMMLPPTVVSLPFKLLLFVLVDGWRLIAQSLVTSFS
jgi:flagellar biosynthetic protein FliP